MTIPLDEPKVGGLPVVKRQRIGETYVGAIVKYERRPRKKATGEVIINPKNGKPRQELVVTCITMPGTNSEAALGASGGPCHPGDLVRVIIHGGAYAAWIEWTDKLPADPRPNAAGAGVPQVGDVLSYTLEYAVTYAGEGAPPGPKMTTQAQLDAVPRGTSLGVYGPLVVRRLAPSEMAWETAAETAFHQLKDAPPAAEANNGNGHYVEEEQPF